MTARPFVVSSCLAGCLLLGLCPAAFPATEAPAEPRASIEEIAAAIERHIAEKSEADGGYYELPHQGKDLRLKLVRVHMEYLSDLGGGVQFACVDLVGTDGPVYDVDFFLKGKPGGTLTVTETTVHKLNGQPLYTWEQVEDATWRRVAVEDASDRLLGVIRGRDAFEFTYRVTLPELSGPAELWLPLAQSDAFQTVEIAEIKAPAPSRRLEDTVHGNKVLYLAVSPEDSGKRVVVRYRVHRREKPPYSATEPDPRIFLEPETLVPANDTFREIAMEVTEGKPTDLMRARALYDHVIEKVRYARYGTGWGRGDAVYACNAASGNCTDFHAYFIALARAVDIPARFAIGASIPSERNDGGADGYHCWAEFYADKQWWPVDISEADKNSKLATYYFGHQPANRLELSTGRDLVVEPSPASGPINFLAYPVLEVRGQPVKARTEFLFRRLGSRGQEHQG